MNLSLKIRKNLVVPALLFYYVIISIIFTKYISVYFGYQGFRFSLSYSCLYVSFFVVVVTAFQVERLLNRRLFSDCIVVLVSIMYLFPVCVLFAFSNNDVEYFLFVLLYFMFLNFFNEFVNVSDKKISVRSKANLFYGAFIILGFMMIVISGAYTGFRISLDLSDVYEYRMEAREYAMPFFLRYPFSWTVYILPVGLMCSLVKGKKLLSVYLCFCQILCFSFNGKKTVLFSLILVLLINLLYRKSKNLDLLTPYAFFSLGALSFVEVMAKGSEAFLAKAFIRRMMFVPAYLGSIYYDFFKHNELDYLRSSFLRYFGFTSPYVDSIPRTIGRVYFNAPEMNANTGLCGDAFSNFGWLGVVIYPFLIILLVKVLDKYMSNVEIQVKFIVMILLSYMFLNGSYFKLLLTNGIFILLLILIMYPIDESQLTDGKIG